MKSRISIRAVLIAAVFAAALLPAVPTLAANNYKQAYASLLKRTSVGYPIRTAVRSTTYEDDRITIDPSKMHYLLLDINRDGTPELILFERMKGADCGFTNLYIYTYSETKKAALSCRFENTRYNGASGPICFETYLTSINYCPAKRALALTRTSSLPERDDDSSSKEYMLVSLKGNTLKYSLLLTHLTTPSSKSYLTRNTKNGAMVSLKRLDFQSRVAAFKALSVRKHGPRLNAKANRIKSFGAEYA